MRGLKEIVILVPYRDRHNIDNMAAPDFVIERSFKSRATESRVFVVNTTEDTLLMLILRYGNDRVWKK